MDTAFWDARRRFMQLRAMNIRPDDLVLDIGSGGSPNWRANVLCDKFIIDATERTGMSLYTGPGQCVIIGDAVCLPFQDHAFDYVICTHILEHVDDPATFLSEVQRVAPRGYIETPSPVLEAARSCPYHRWVVTRDQQRLVLYRKPRLVLNKELQVWFEDLVHNNRQFYRYVYMCPESSGLITRFEWEGEIPFEIQDLPSDVDSSAGWDSAELDRVVTGAGAMGLNDCRKHWLDRLYGPYLRRHSHGRLDSLEQLLACPWCFQAVRKDRDWHCCTGCTAMYPTSHGYPVLLREAAQWPITGGPPHVGHIE